MIKKISLKKTSTDTDNGLNVMPMIKNRIDNMPYAEMVRQYKSSSGTILFQGDHRKYFEKIMKQKKLGQTTKTQKTIKTKVLKDVYNRF